MTYMKTKQHKSEFLKDGILCFRHEEEVGLLHYSKSWAPACLENQYIKILALNFDKKLTSDTVTRKETYKIFWVVTKDYVIEKYTYFILYIPLSR